jgi:predicted metal-dependent hydrolase
MRAVDAGERQRLMEAGRAAFNRGEFYDAHEHWEDVWNEADDPERRWIQGLIQVATGLHKVSGDKRGPARTLLEKALGKLVDAPADFSGWDVAAMKREAETALATLVGGKLPDARAVRLRKAT